MADCLTNMLIHLLTDLLTYLLTDDCIAFTSLLKLFTDTFANLCKADDSLKRKVAELKNVLATREEIHKKQKQLVKMLAVDAQNRFKKASAEAAALTEELKTCKSKCQLLF